MRAGVNYLCGGVMASLLSLVCLAAPGSDVRLAEAARANNHAAILALLQEHADVNAAQADGATALHWAVHWDDLEAAGLLIRAGANANAANDHGVTPLFLACENRSARMVEALLRAGADPNPVRRTGETPLMACAMTGSAEAAQSLLARGANVHARESRRGQTALMWAVAGKHTDVVRALVKHGADVHERSASGFTPLLFAAQQGDLEATRVLLDADARVDEGAPEHGTPLIVATASGHQSLALFLLEQGADPNARDGDGITALHYAVRKGLSDIIGYRYDTPYELPRPNLPELAEALLARGADPNVRIKRSLYTFPSRAPDQVSMVEATPFFLAAVSGDAGLMKALAAKGSDPLLPARGDITPLMAAAGGARNANRSEQERQDALQAVKLALALGGDVHAADAKGQTAMHVAAFTGADGVVQFLAEQGARVDVRDKSGETPWSMAMGISPEPRYKGLYGHHQSTADLLVKLGASPTTMTEILANADPAAAPEYEAPVTRAQGQ